eukprot:16209467-Heterocapsa_arctica.AAC.1
MISSSVKNIRSPSSEHADTDLRDADNWNPGGTGGEAGSRRRGTAEAAPFHWRLLGPWMKVHESPALHLLSANNVQYVFL